MNAKTIKALAVGFGLMSHTACASQPDLENWEKTRHFERAVSETPMARVFETMAAQSMQGLFEDAFFRDIFAEADFTIRDLQRLLTQGYGAYALEIEDYTHRTIAAELDEADVELLFTLATDPTLIETAACAYARPAVSGEVDWAGCESDGHTPVSAEFIAAHQRYTAAYQRVLDGERAQTYFGGIACRVLEEIEQRVSTSGNELDFSNTQLGLTTQGKEPCSELKARLDELDRLNNGPDA